jgi:hypothetical protein
MSDILSAELVLILFDSGKDTTFEPVLGKVVPWFYEVSLSIPFYFVDEN